MSEVNAEIIAVGTEILLGEITDTNSVFLAKALRDLGINLYFMTSVGDNQRRIAEAVRIALSRAQVVITCGGLGPTVDDVTREGVAAATERSLIFHQALLDSIAERFAGFRVQMTENNLRQAYIPEGAIIVENPVGTAPSFIVEQGNHIVLSLPGVPREMKFLFTENIVPYLKQKYALGDTMIVAKVLKAAGIGESALDEALGTDLLEASNPTVGLAAHSGQVDIRITAKGDNLDQVNAMIGSTEAVIRARVGSYIYGINGDTIEAAISDLLRLHHGSIAICEVGVPPLVSERLAQADELPFSTVDFESLPVVCAALGISERDSIREIAEKLATTIATAQRATIGIAVLSREDGDTDHADREALSALAVYCNGSVRSRSYGFSGGADVARQFMGTWALSMAWRMLKEA
jgi:nicotinamide-nucleotide amidase